MSFFVRDSIRETIQINSSLDVILKVRNESGTTINIGKPIYLSGHNSVLDIPLINIANASSEETMPCIGITQESINNGSNGYIKQLGKLDYDTSSLGFTLGDTLYVSSTGDLTNILPTGTNVVTQSVAIMGYSNVNDGFIIVKTIGGGSSSNIEVDINNLENSVLLLQGNVSTLEGNISVLQSNISTLESNITLANSNILALESNIFLATSNIINIENNISTYESNILLLESNISVLESNVIILDGNVSVLEGNISILEGNISILESNISVLYGNVSILESDILEIQSNILSLNSNILLLNNNINTIESNISTLEGNITIIESNVNVLESNISLLESNISVLESNVLLLESNVNVLETNLQSINNDFIGVHITYINSNINLDSEGNINLITGVSGNVYVDGVLLNNISGGTTLPVLGDSNIYIGNGTETSQVAISGDIKLINTGKTELISISNTSTISSTANIKLNTSKGLYFNDSSKYILYNGSNLDINLNTGNIRLLTDNGNLYIDNINIPSYLNTINNEITVLETSNTIINTRVDNLEIKTSGLDIINNNLVISSLNGDIRLLPETNKKVIVESNLSILGNLNVIGETTIVKSNITIIDDPVIELGISNINETSFDRGIKGNWYDGGVQTLFFGMERDSKKFKYIPYATFDSSTGNVIVSGAPGSVEFGNMYLNDNTESYSSTTGTLISNGGVGIASNLYVGGNTFINNELYINNIGITPRLNTLETDNILINGRVTNIESNISNIILTNSNLDISSYGNINLNTNTGNLYINSVKLENIGGNITGITYLDPDLNIESATGNININATNDLFLGKHTIVSNTFTLTQNFISGLSGTQSLTLDMNLSSDFYYTLQSGANITLNNPLNTTRIGQQGSIIFKTSGTGHILNWFSGGKWYFNSGIAPNLTGTDGTLDIFNYIIVEENIIVVNDSVNYQQY